MRIGFAFYSVSYSFLLQPHTNTDGERIDSCLSNIANSSRELSTSVSDSVKCKNRELINIC